MSGSVGYGFNRYSPGKRIVVSVLTQSGDLIRHAYPKNAVSLESVIRTSLEMGLEVEVKMVN